MKVRLRKILFFFLFSAVFAIGFGQSIPANDNCENALSMVVEYGKQYCTTSTNLNARSSGITNACDGAPAGNEVWYKFFTPGDSTDITITPTGVQPISNLAVTLYTGDICGGLSTWNCFNTTGNNPINISYNQPKGSYVWLEIESNNTDGDFEICISSEDHIVLGDDICSAKQICTLEPFHSTMSGLTASGQTYCSGASTIQDGYIKFSVGTTGTLEFVITPDGTTEFDWSVYDITSGCSSEVEVACNHNFSGQFAGCFFVGTAPTGMLSDTTGYPCTLEFEDPINVFAGRTYAILIDDYDADGQGFTFEWGPGTMKLDVVADYDVSPKSSCTIPLNPTFTDNFSGNITSYDFNFGDGTYGTASDISSITSSLSYTDYGDYLIGIKANGAVSGCSDAMSKRINMNQGPVIELSPADTSICGRDSFQVRSVAGFGRPTLPAYYSDTTVETIPDPPPPNKGITKTINVSGISPATLKTGTISDVCFTLTHPSSLSDYQEITLTNPDGITVSFEPLPLSGSGTQTFCFADSTLYGLTGNTNGNWELYVEDNVNNNIEGTIDSFGFTINYDNTISSISWSHPDFVTDTNSMNPYVKPDSGIVLELTALDQYSCATKERINISMLSNPFASFSDPDTVCYGDSAQIDIALSGTPPFDFTYFDGATNTTVTNYSGTSYSFWESLTKQFEIISISDSICNGYQFDSVPFTRLDSVKVDTVRLPCNGAQTKYVVEIDISGSDSNIYQVTGGNGTIVLGNPTTFVSDSILSGENYEFFVTDIYNCNTIKVDGNRNCLCDANANISGSDTICDGDSTQLSVDLFGAGSWSLYFSNGTSNYVESGIASSPYTFYAKDSGHFVIDSVSDINCMTRLGKDSSFVHVVDAPTATVSGGDSICYGDSATILIELTGIPNWNMDVFDGTSTNSYNLTSNQLEIKTGDSGTYQVTLLVDNSCPGFDLGGTEVVTVLEPDTAVFNYPDSIPCEESGPQLPSFSANSDLGGIFSVSPTSLPIDSSTGEISIDSGVPVQQYIITYQSPSNYCSTVAYDTVRIVPTDIAKFGYPQYKYCPEGTVLPTLDSNISPGYFSSVPSTLAVDSVTGEIDLSTGIMDSIYTVRYITTGCVNIHSRAIKMNGKDQAGFSYTNTLFCKKDSISPKLDSGTVFGGYFWSNNTNVAIDSSSGKINLDSTSVVNTKVIIYYTTPPGICQSTDSVDLRFRNQPDARNLDLSFCESEYGTRMVSFSMVDSSHNYKDTINNPNRYYYLWYEARDSLMADARMPTVINVKYTDGDTVFVKSFDSTLTCYDTSYIAFHISGSAKAGTDDSASLELAEVAGTLVDLNSLMLSDKSEFGTWYDPDGQQIGDSILPEDYLEGGVFMYVDTAMSPCVNDTSYLKISVTESLNLDGFPNAFTPNGDDVNETWDIPALHVLYPECKVRIFNRWGEKVFESNGYETPWDGAYKGTKVDASTYYYIIDFGDGSTPQKRGTVTIVK